jgi:hypothetical protein
MPGWNCEAMKMLQVRVRQDLPAQFEPGDDRALDRSQDFSRLETAGPDAPRGDG